MRSGTCSNGTQGSSAGTDLNQATPTVTLIALAERKILKEWSNPWSQKPTNCCCASWMLVCSDDSSRCLTSQTINCNNEFLLVGCLTSQQQASVSQGRICSDNFTCCHTEIEVADQTFYLTQSQYTDTRPTRPSADPITPGAWQGSHWNANF